MGGERGRGHVGNVLDGERIQPLGMQDLAVVAGERVIRPGDHEIGPPGPCGEGASATCTVVEVAKDAGMATAAATRKAGRSSRHSTRIHDVIATAG